MKANVLSNNKMGNNVFFSAGLGVGVIIDGTIGFELYETTFNNEEKVFQTLRIYPLDHRQAVGDRDEDNPLVKEGAFIDLCFGSAKSVEVFIDALNEFNNLFYEKVQSTSNP